MRRCSAIIVIGTLIILSSACVTRNKHAATIADWEGRHDAALQEQERLRAESQDKDRKIEDIETELQVYKEGAESRQADLQERLEQRRAEVEALRKQRAQIEASLRQYRGLREAFDKMIGAGELEVYRRHGRIMVALPSSVLFPSGKASLSPAGQKAVAQVAKVLATLDGRRFLVAGHTDNVPIRTSQFQDNWDLSAARATTVTRFLIENGMTPESLAAAGYGEYDAVRNNKTAENRRRNRRIEIVLMPNIDELPELPE